MAQENLEINFYKTKNIEQISQDKLPGNGSFIYDTSNDGFYIVENNKTHSLNANFIGLLSTTKGGTGKKFDDFDALAKEINDKGPKIFMQEADFTTANLNGTTFDEEGEEGSGIWVAECPLLNGDKIYTTDYPIIDLNIASNKLGEQTETLIKQYSEIDTIEITGDDTKATDKGTVRVYKYSASQPDPLKLSLKILVFRSGGSN